MHREVFEQAVFGKKLMAFERRINLGDGRQRTCSREILEEEI
jgi:hypothetical protein